MTRAEMAEFAVQNIEPFPSKKSGYQYRVAAHLIDGTYLPCVVLESKQAELNRALRRFEELRWKGEQFKLSVESFVSGSSRVAEYHLRDVEVSPFAWPLEVLGNIGSETTMAWTAFVTEMKDGTMHSYGTEYGFWFFDLPSGYSHSDIANIHSGVVYSKDRGIEDYFHVTSREEYKPLRERPFFTCYLRELDSGRQLK